MGLGVGLLGVYLLGVALMYLFSFPFMHLLVSCITSSARLMGMTVFISSFMMLLYELSIIH